MRAGTLPVSLTAYFQHLEQPLLHGYNRQQCLSKNSTHDILSKGVENWSKQLTKLILFPCTVPYSALSQCYTKNGQSSKYNLQDTETNNS